MPCAIVSVLDVISRERHSRHSSIPNNSRTAIPTGSQIQRWDAVPNSWERSLSAAEARWLGFLKPSDNITINRERLLTDAKTRARAIADAGYSAPAPRTDSCTVPRAQAVDRPVPGV